MIEMLQLLAGIFGCGIIVLMRNQQAKIMVSENKTEMKSDDNNIL